MTRTYTACPIWTWQCDHCGKEAHLAREQSGEYGLPSINEMRVAGWYIAEKFGDLCPLCVIASLAPTEPESSS